MTSSHESVTVPLTAEERATVLAALRHWQKQLGEDSRLPPSDPQIDGFRPLTVVEIDRLGERLNSAGNTLRRPTSRRRSPQRPRARTRKPMTAGRVMTMRPMESATGAESGLSAGLAEALDRADEAMGQITQALGHGADHAHNAEWPALPRRGWRNAIRDGMTSLGYWHWAAFMLANPEQLQEDAL